MNDATLKLRSRVFGACLETAPASPPVASRPEASAVLRLEVGGIGAEIRPASVLIRLDRPLRSDELRALDRVLMQAHVEIVAIGSAAEIDAHPAAETALGLDLPGAALVPGLVNAHTHLDLTAVGPQPIDPQAPFADWLQGVMAGRETTYEAITHAVEMGIELLTRGGVVAVGDIAGCPPTGLTDAAPLALARSTLAGVSFAEFFAIGAKESERFARFEAFVRGLHRVWPAASDVRLGLSPHAPYSVGSSSYAAAHRLAHEMGLGLCTHLAESLEERHFISEGRGPQVEMLRAWGLWDAAIEQEIGRGNHPIEHTLAAMPRDSEARPHLVGVHLNDLGEPSERGELIELLKAAAVAVVYCPRASTYFGAPASLGPHGYRDLLDAGVPVALGTDSIINLPQAQAEQGLTPWHDARLLVERDGLSPAAALDMITIGGARVLGLDPNAYALESGSKPRGLGIVPIPTNPGSKGVFGGVFPPMLVFTAICCSTGKDPVWQE